MNTLPMLSQVCVICVEAELPSRESVTMLRERVVTGLERESFVPRVVQQNIVNLPADALNVKDRLQRTHILVSLRRRRYLQLHIAGVTLGDFAREAVVAAVAADVPIVFHPYTAGVLSRYRQWFDEAAKKQAQAQRRA